MKPIVCLFLLYFSKTVLYGQPNIGNKAQTDSTTQVLLLSPNMFTNSEYFRISPMYFIKGNDSTYAQKECDISRWQRLKPNDIKSDLYDENKRLEGWFRTKIKVDTAFKGTPFYIKLFTWGAVDLYIDGKLIKQFGNTGSNGQPFKEYNYINKVPTLTNLQAGQEYVLALHYVDYLSPFPPHKIKYNPWFVITTNEYVERITKYYNEEPIYYTLWVVVSGLISLLLWILAIQNRDEKHLRLIAILITLLTLSAIAEGITNSPTVTNVVSYLNFRMARIVSGLMGIILPLLIVRIFNREDTKTLKVLLTLVFLGHVAPIFYLENNILTYFRTFMPILICLYYIITSRKTLKGAQWAVVAGLLISLSWLSIMFFYAVVYKKYNTTGQKPN